MIEVINSEQPMIDAILLTDRYGGGAVQEGKGKSRCLR